MLSIKINNQPYQLPEVDDLAFDVYCKLAECKTDKAKLELLLNADLSTIPAKCEREVNNALVLVDLVQDEIQGFLSGELKPQETIEVKLFDTKVKFTKDLGKLAYWPMTKVKALIKAMGTEPYNKHDHYKSLVGHYLYSKINTYDEYLAEDFCNDVVGKLPFKTVLMLGDFFLFTQRHLWLPKKDGSILNRQMKKKLRTLQSLKNTGS